MTDEIESVNFFGNVRLSFTRNLDDGSAEALSSNDYYPFGLNFINVGGRTIPQRYNPSVSFENFKYNGKELEETGMYDQDARFYMPDIGRFSTHDPLSEVTFDPYGFAYNNPIFYNDPTGMEGEEANSDTGGGGGETGAGGEGPGGGGSYDPRGKGPNDAWHNKGYDAFFPRDTNSGGGKSSGGYDASVQSGGGGGPGPKKKPSISERTSKWVYDNFTSHNIAWVNDNIRSKFTPSAEGQAILDEMRSYSTNYMRSTVGGAYRDAANYGIVGQGLESLNVGSFLGSTRTANRLVNWNLGEAVITKSHHNWSKVFGNRNIKLADIKPIVQEAINNGSWKVTDVIRKKRGQVIGDKLEMVQKVNGHKIWVGGMREHSTGKIIVNNAAVQ